MAVTTLLGDNSPVRSRQPTWPVTARVLASINPPGGHKMSGKRMTVKQVEVYRMARKEGFTQAVSAAKSGISERSGRRIEGQLSNAFPKKHPGNNTREDPLDGIWSSKLVPLLETNPALTPATLFDWLGDHCPGEYEASITRTLQRRVKQWKIVYGPDKEVMFRQVKIPALMGISDFTTLKRVTVTIQGVTFEHILYHYRLVFSGWCYVKIILGGESFAALSAGLQEALWRCGGTPIEHRTDSLSAAFNNRAEKEQLTVRYEELCKHYNLKPTRNNLGISHENGAIESPNGHLKRKIEQALLIRESNDFESLDDYQSFIDVIVGKINRSVKTRFQEERESLNPLPKRRTHDYLQEYVVVTSSSTIALKRVTYSVPSKLVGTRLCVHVHDDRLVMFSGHVEVFQTDRLFADKNHRSRSIDYRHLIESLARKPGAFYYSQLRDDLLPSEDYRQIWRYLDDNLDSRSASRYIVKVLLTAARNDCEGSLGRYILNHISRGQLPTETDYQKRFSTVIEIPDIIVKQHALKDYDQLISQEVQCG